MGQNMSTTDRVLRTFVAAPLLVLAGVLVGPTAVLSWVCYVLAAVMLGTSAITWFPLYALGGLSARRRCRDGAPAARPQDAICRAHVLAHGALLRLSDTSWSPQGRPPVFGCDPASGGSVARGRSTKGPLPAQPPCIFR